MKPFKKFSMYDDQPTTASDSTGSNMKTTEAIDRIQKDAENYFKNLKWMESWKFAPVKEAYTAGATYERNKAIDDCIKVLETYVCDMYLIPILESLKTKQP